MQLDGLGAGMFLDVIESFLNNAEEIELHLAWPALFNAGDAALDDEVGPGLNLLAEVAAGGGLPEGVQIAGPQVVGYSAVFLQGLDHQLVAAAKYFPGGRA